MPSALASTGYKNSQSLGQDPLRRGGPNSLLRPCRVTAATICLHVAHGPIY